MSKEDERKSQVGNEIDGLLTDEERRKLLANLHRVLVWVGVKEPEERWNEFLDKVKKD